MSKIPSLIFSKILVLVIFMSRILEVLKISFPLVNKAIDCFLEAVFSLFLHCFSHSRFPSDVRWSWVVGWLIFKSGNWLKTKKLMEKWAPGLTCWLWPSLGLSQGMLAVCFFGAFILGCPVSIQVPSPLGLQVGGPQHSACMCFSRESGISQSRSP